MNKALLILLFSALLGPSLAFAGLSFVRELRKDDVGKELTTGLYTVPESLVMTGGVAQSALAIAQGATVALYIEKGKTLDVTGGDASETKGAGAGICVPDTANLIVVGEGTVKATGGAASPGLAGGACGKWVLTNETTIAETTGAGGAGGAGGNGAGAGIGGIGGIGGAGGAGGEGIVAIVQLDTQFDGNAGEAGWEGSDTDSKSVGNITFVGPIVVTAVSGPAADGGTNGWAMVDGQLWTEAYQSVYHRVGAGGPGGGGGGGAAAHAGIGYGGPGGGGGGGGGSGGVSFPSLYPFGRSGRGGEPNGLAASHSAATCGGTGGVGGTVPDHSANPCPIYFTSSATNAVVGAGTTNIVTAPADIRYTISFDDSDSELSAEPPSPITATLSEPYGTCGSAAAKKKNRFFLGWYDGKGGTGTRYFDSQGNPTLTVFPHPGDLTLHPWVGGIESIPTGMAIDGKTVASGTSTGEGWTCTDCVITFTGRDTPYRLSGTNEFGYVALNVVTNATFVFDSVQIPKMCYEGQSGIFNVASGCTATVTLKGESTLVTSSDKTAALFCPRGATLTLVGLDSGITCDDSQPGQCSISVVNVRERFNLIAQGGAGAAAIGGVDGQDNGRSGSIVFKDANVAASGGVGRDGVPSPSAATDVGHASLTGGATPGECGRIRISGGTSLRPIVDASTDRKNPITVDPSPYSYYDRKVLPFRCLTTAMSYGFWVSYGLTTANYKGSDETQTGTMSVTLTPTNTVETATYSGTAEPITEPTE